MSKIHDFVNPFRKFRAEHFSEDLWNYYVPGPFSDLLGARPLMIEGGRGSGKTMFFLFNSWREQRLAPEKEDLGSSSSSHGRLLLPGHHVGLYYKVDASFVTALEGNDVRESVWVGVFSTYLSVSILQELMHFLHALESDGGCTTEDLRPVFTRVGEMLGAEVCSIEETRRLLNRTLDSVELVANNPTEIVKVRGTVAGRLLAEIVAVLRLNSLFSRAVFYVFIDEYETLLEYQQRQINTLMKQSSSFLVYNIGLRPKGMKTAKTASDTEQIESPHDYRVFRPELALLPEAQLNNRKLEKVLSDICEKRIRNAGVLPEGVDEKWYRLETYLGSYDVDTELAVLSAGADHGAIVRALKKAIDSVESDQKKADECLDVLGVNASAAHARLHLCLLRRKPRYRPTPSGLVREYRLWCDDPTSSTQYANWWHNTSMGLVFLLAHEQKRKKVYAGFDVYCMLSSGIIRYFIELCEQAFDFAHENGFSWLSPRVLTQEEQSRAARWVSQYKIRDIERYDPYGAKLRQLTTELGSLYGALHTDSGTTLGEPEPNHFSTQTADLINDTSGLRGVLDAAVLWTVLQERSSTKDKGDRSVEVIEYHLNHIYCPYFGISCRSKRKLNISVVELREMLSPDVESGEVSARQDVARRTAVTPKMKALRSVIGRAQQEEEESVNELITGAEKQLDLF